MEMAVPPSLGEWFITILDFETFLGVVRKPYSCSSKVEFHFQHFDFCEGAKETFHKSNFGSWKIYGGGTPPVAPSY